MLVESKLSKEIAIKEFTGQKEQPKSQVIQGKRIFLQSSKQNMRSNTMSMTPYTAFSIANIKPVKKTQEKDIGDYLDEYNKVIEEDNLKIKGYLQNKRPKQIQQNKKFFELSQDYQTLAGSTQQYGLIVNSDVKKKALKNTVLALRKFRIQKL